MGSACLALGAMPIATRVVSDLLFLTACAAKYMPAQCSTATAFDRRHRLELPQADMPCVGFAPRRAKVAEDIRNFKLTQ